jgi:hypothetical protein
MLLAGCGTSIDCDKNVDGKGLLESLTDPRTSLEIAAKNVLQLASVCKPNNEQQKLIDKTTEKIASDGTIKLQSDFYTRLTELIPKSPLRQIFVTHSSFINNNEKLPVENLHSVKLEQLHPFNRKTAPRSLLEFESSHHNTDNSIHYQVETDYGTFIVLASSDGTRVIVDGSHSGFNDSLVHCNEEYTKCGAKIARYILDQNNKLKYLVNIYSTELEGGSQCKVDMDVSRLKGISMGKDSDMSIEHDVELSMKKEFDCTSPAVIHSGLAFSDREILSRLTLANPTPNPASLINFNVKDDADRELKNRLWSQGSKWKRSLLEDAVDPIGTSDESYEAISNHIQIAASNYDNYEVLSKSLTVATSNLKNLKWLISNPTPELSTQLSSLENFINTLQTRLNAIKPSEPPKEPPQPDKNEWIYERVSIAIAREAQQTDSAVIRIPDTPFVYIGFIFQSYPEMRVILYSQKRLTDRPGIVNVFAIRGNKPLQVMTEGFSKDVWVYKTLSDQERVEYDEYVKLKQEYQRLLAEYTSVRNKAESERNVIASEVGKLDQLFQRIVENVGAK